MPFYSVCAFMYVCVCVTYAIVCADNDGCISLGCNRIGIQQALQQQQQRK